MCLLGVSSHPTRWVVVPTWGGPQRGRHQPPEGLENKERTYVNNFSNRKTKSAKNKSLGISLMRAFIVAAQAVSMSSRMCIKLAYVNVEARIRTCARLVRFWYPREHRSECGASAAPTPQRSAAFSTSAHFEGLGTPREFWFCGSRAFCGPCCRGRGLHGSFAALRIAIFMLASRRGTAFGRVLSV